MKTLANPDNPCLAVINRNPSPSPSPSPSPNPNQATAAIQRAFPKAYLYDPTPVGAALWRIARHTPAVSRREDGRYVFVQP